MRASVLVVLSLALGAGTAFAQEEESVEEEALQRVGVLVVPSSKKLQGVAADLEELLVASFTSRTPFGALGGEELRDTVEPDKPFKVQNKAVQDCLKEPSCVGPLMVKLDMIFWTVSYVGKSGKGLRLRLTLFDLHGKSIAVHDSGRVTQEQLYADTFITAEKLIGKHRGTINIKVPKDATVMVNDDSHPGGETRLSFLEPAAYEIVVKSKGKRPAYRSVDLVAGQIRTIEVKSEDLKPWVSRAVKQKRDQGIAYYRKDKFKLAATTLEQARALEGGDQDAKLLFYLTRCYVDLNVLERAFEAAEAATKTHDPNSKFAKRGAELLAKLHRSYGSVIFKKDSGSRAPVGYIYLEDVGGLINKEKKKQFKQLRDRLNSSPVDLTKDGYVFYLPHGKYKANAVPFSVEPGKLPEVELILQASSRREDAGTALSTPVLISSGVAATGLLVGIGLHLKAVSDAGDYESAGDQKKAFEARDSAQLFETTAMVSYGIALAAGGVATWLWMDGRKESTRVLIGPQGFVMGGSF